MPNPLAGTLIFVIVFWLIGYSFQRDEHSLYARVKASRRVRALFGDFRESGTLSVFGMVLQMISYLLVLGGVIAEITIVDPYVRGMMIVIWLFLLLLLGGIFRAIISRGRE